MQFYCGGNFSKPNLFSRQTLVRDLTKIDKGTKLNTCCPVTWYATKQLEGAPK